MQRSVIVTAIFLGTASVAIAEPFQEVTIGLPVASLSEAEVWYAGLIGPDVEVIRPAPGVVEFKVAPGVWLQLFETDNSQAAGAVVRFSVEDFAAAQQVRTALGINTGEAITVPDIVTYSEFTDPYGNALGFYSLP